MRLAWEPSYLDWPNSEAALVSSLNRIRHPPEACKFVQLQRQLKYGVTAAQTIHAFTNAASVSITCFFAYHETLDPLAKGWPGLILHLVAYAAATHL